MQTSPKWQAVIKVLHLVLYFGHKWPKPTSTSLFMYLFFFSRDLCVKNWWKIHSPLLRFSVQAYVNYLMMLLQAPHRGVRLLAANLSALWATPLATGANGAGLGVMGAGLGAAGAGAPGEELGMYAGGGGAAWGSGCTFMVVVVILLGSNLSAKLVSDTQGGLLEEAGAAGAGAAAGGRG